MFYACAYIIKELTKIKTHALEVIAVVLIFINRVPEWVAYHVCTSAIQLLVKQRILI
jgi:hypothetical protein